MKKLYTAAEIARRRLPGLPTTKSSILARAAKEGWPYEEQYGIGGVRKVFQLPERYLTLDERAKQGVLSARQNLEKYLVSSSTVEEDGEIPHLDETSLVIAARILEEWLHAEKRILSHEKKGALIALLYKLVSRNVAPEDLLKLMCVSASAITTIDRGVDGRLEDICDFPVI